MISLLGHLVVDLGLLTAVTGAAASFAAVRYPELVPWGRRAALIVAGTVAAAVLLMEIALIGHDYSVKYVADVGGPNVPLYYTIISLWAALEGSILFWALLLSLYTVVFLRIYRDRFTELRPYLGGVLLTLSAFFLFVIAIPSDPFAQVDPDIACLTACQGPNPLLQNHWMMGVHPVLLYLGYVGLSIPFAITMASLMHGTPGPEVLRLIRRWALIPWIFLSLGIVAGMWWSYAVLGWGGYWSWDPVENASVMPWLVTTAFLHSLQVQERRQMLKAWTMSLIIAAFLLSLLGTFLTRSGVLASVHSFTQSSVGPVFLTFFGAALLLSLGLLFARSRELAAPGALQSAICRETAFLVNNLLLVAITFTILLGTLYPLLAEAVQNQQLSVGAPYFDNVAVPIGFVLLFLMGIGPALPWGATRLEELQYRLLGPVAAGVTVVLVLLLAGVRGVGPLATFGAAGFVLAVTFGRIAADLRARRRNTSESHLPAVRRLLGANPRRYGGYLAHIGVLLVLVGIAASQSYQLRASATLRPGETVSIGGYAVTYEGWQPRPEDNGNRMVIRGAASVTETGESLGTLYPSQNVYPSLAQPVLTPAVREEPLDMVGGLFEGKNPLPQLGQIFQGRNPLEDLYIVLAGVSSKPNGAATLEVLVNPLVGLIWVGGFVLGLGGLIALTPARRRRRVAVSAPEPARHMPQVAVPGEEAAV